MRIALMCAPPQRTPNFSSTMTLQAPLELKVLVPWGHTKMTWCRSGSDCMGAGPMQMQMIGLS